MNSGLLRHGRALRTAGSVLAATTATVMLTGTAAQAAGLGDLASAEAGSPRVLQSVDVDLAPDGTLTNIDGTVVESTSQDASDADTSDTEYAPNEVAGQLPLRVMTAWRTEDGAGTDLSDLDGYDGQVRIDLTVQNLTVRPETLQYDVDGKSREQAALVGSPLTVVAAADLGELPSESVITAGVLPSDAVTNGVLGKGEEGETQVQWATILAPPQLGSSARFSLVVDAKNFQVPDLDISVQPGLVTDPSMGALVDSAFNPKSSTELQLQRNTIELVGDVNGVLARASSTISQVRRILSGSAETLGERTVQDLRASTQSVADSMEALGTSLDALDKQISSQLKATETEALAQLKNSVETVSALLGNTKGGAGSGSVRGTGCAATVAGGGGDGSLYGSIVAVATQLNGYAKATDSCKTELQSVILTTIGPEEPTASNCVGVMEASVTCEMLGANAVFDEIAQNMADLAEKTKQILNPTNYSEAIRLSGELSRFATEAQHLADLVTAGRKDIGRSLEHIEAEVAVGGELDRHINDLEDRFAGFAEQAGAAGTAADEAVGQAEAAAGEVCTLSDTLLDDLGLPDGSATPLTDERERSIRAYLVQTDCAGEPNRGGVTKPEDSVQGLLTLPDSDFRVALAEIKTLANTVAGSPTGEALAALRNDRAQLAAWVANAQDTYVCDPVTTNPCDETVDDSKRKKFNEWVEVLVAKVEQMKATQTELARQYEALNKLYVEMTTALDEAVAEAKADTKRKLEEALDSEVKNVYQAGQRASTEFETKFGKFSEGLRDMADQVVRDGRRQVDSTKSEFATAQAKAGQNISSKVEEGLAQISAGVTSSTRNMGAATGLLTADLRKVLLDLGERRVNGGGLLGAMSTSAATAGSADEQLALATGKTHAYSNVRSRDIAGILLRQAQTDAAMQMLADMPPFELELEAGTLHRTVYNYRIGAGQ